MYSNIVNNFKQAFDKNLFSILLYGSVLEGKKSYDLDLIVILKNKTNVSSDLGKLNEFVLHFNPKVNLDLQLFYMEELFNPSCFSLDALGSFFVEILKNAETLFGENPFTNMSLPNNFRQISSLNKVQNYIFRLRQEAIGLGRHSKDKNPNYHKKKIIRIIDDIMISLNLFDNRENRLRSFQSVFPSVLSNSEVSFIEDTALVSFEKCIEIYEKLYSFILKILKDHLPINIKPKRVNLNGIVSEYIFPSNNNGKVMIILDGLPAVPDGENIMNIFASKGYVTFYPRYRGTWESTGEFLHESPILDIEELIRNIKSGIMLGDKEFKSDNFTILGTSFGGAVALSLSHDPSIEKLILCSPVTSFSKIPTLATLSPFLRKMFPGAYRYDESNWQKLLNDKLLNMEVPRNAPTFIFGGMKDPEVTPELLSEYCARNDVELKLFENLGHISFSKVKDTMLQSILNIV